MKKINYILLIITIICGTFSALNQLDQGIVIFLKNISIILTVSLPFIYEKIFKTKLPLFLITVWIIFVFMAHYLGVILNGYNNYPGFDKVTHTLSGVLTACFAITILEKVKIKNLKFAFTFIIAFSWMIAGLWETFEFVCNILVGGDAQRVVDTGVDDTMLDMIVAFIGSIITATIYIFKK